jgi:hypothetical protein
VTKKLVRDLLKKAEGALGKEMKVTLADYVRLVQLKRELDEEEPKEIRVTWVDPPES